MAQETNRTRIQFTCNATFEDTPWGHQLIGECGRSRMGESAGELEQQDFRKALLGNCNACPIISEEYPQTGETCTAVTYYDIGPDLLEYYEKNPPIGPHGEGYR